MYSTSSAQVLGKHPGGTGILPVFDQTLPIPPQMQISAVKALRDINACIIT
jgi:hypothetical protein